MAKRDIAALPPPTVFLTLEETAARWRRTTITTRRILRKFGVATHRLTGRDHLYALAEIEAVERASLTRAPKVAKNYDCLLASKQSKTEGARHKMNARRMERCAVARGARELDRWIGGRRISTTTRAIQQLRGTRHDCRALAIHRVLRPARAITPTRTKQRLSPPCHPMSRASACGKTIRVNTPRKRDRPWPSITAC
jgi:hypothetical protein